MNNSGYFNPINQGQVIEERTRTTTTEEFIPNVGFQEPIRTSYVPIRTSYIPASTSYVAGRSSYVPETRTSYVPVTIPRTSYVPVTSYETKYVPHTTIIGRPRTRFYEDTYNSNSYLPQQPVYASNVADNQYLQRSSYRSSYVAPLPVDSGLQYGQQDLYGSQFAQQGLYGSQFAQQGLYDSQFAQQGLYGSQFAQQQQQQGAPWVGRTLIIRPVAAQLTHNTDFFLFKMDPFVEIAIGPNRYKTTIHKNGGKRPQWNETFSHELFGNEGDMTVIVWDQDRKKVDLVGETRINLGQVLAHGSSSNWYELFWRGKTAGRILINLEVV